MLTVNLEDVNSLPTSFLIRLIKHKSLFEKELYFDEIKIIPAISRLVEELNDYCEENMICGFHYTRAIPEDILSGGLRLRSGAEIQSDFLNKYGYRFSQEELGTIKKTWAQCFHEHMRKARDKRIFFNFTTCALHDGRAKLLLKNYGGEQVYFYIHQLAGIGEKISSIGQPLIVKCSLIPSQIKTHIVNPWGSIAVSSYHRSINRDARQIDQDGWQAIPVPPERVEILPYCNTSGA